MDLKESVKYYSSVSAHKDGSELSANMNVHMTNALRAFKNEHGRLPAQIFIYRDGVGDGDISDVCNQELVNIRKLLNQVYTQRGDGVMPKLSFIIVTKRINTRIFLHRSRNAENPAAGTVVDTTITLPER